MYIRMLSPHGGISLCQCDYSIAVSFYITETLVADVSVFYIFKKTLFAVCRYPGVYFGAMRFNDFLCLAV